MLRYILIPLSLLLLLLVAAALLVPVLVDEDKLLALAADELHAQTGATLVVNGETRLSLLPKLGVTLTDAAVTLPDMEQPDLRVRALEVGVRLLPLLSRKIEVDTIRLDGVSLRIDATRRQGASPVQADDVAAGAGTALAVPAALEVAQLLVTDSRLEWVDAASTTVVELARFEATHLNLAGQPISLQLQLRRPGDRPLELGMEGQVRLDQTFQHLDLDGVTMELSGATKAPIKLQASGDIDLAQGMANLDFGQAQIGAHGVDHLHFELRSSGGVYDVTALRGELHRGALVATATLDTTGDATTLTTSGSLKNIDIASVLAASEVKPILAGHATLEWQLAGQGQTGDEMTTALHGPVNLTTESVTLKGTSVEHVLCQTVALSNKEALTATFSTDTQFDLLTADIEVAGGEAILHPLRAHVPGVTLTGDGRFDLRKQDFTASFNARLSNELEALDHACRVSKRLLAIDWPVKCKGNVTTEPTEWCKVETAKILRDLTLNEGRDKLEKKAGKLLDKLFNREN